MSKGVHALSDLPVDGFVRQPQVLRLVPFSSATLWRRIAAGRVPRPVKLGDRITAWRVADIRQFMADPLNYRG